MVVDVILYNGEEDIFNLRYNILKDYVDEFVVVEFGVTFSGNVKQSHPISLPKVSYHFFTQVKDLSPNLPDAFRMEYNQREMLKECLTHLSDTDIVFMGDCDEIWDASALSIDLCQKLRLRVYAYHINNRSDEDFSLGTVIDSYEHIKNSSLNDLRSNVPLTDRYFGWHFTNMGGIEKLKYKIESYGHTEFNTIEIKDSLEKRIEENQDYVGRPFEMWIDESELPTYIIDNKEKYGHLFK